MNSKFLNKLSTKDYSTDLLFPYVQFSLGATFLIFIGFSLGSFILIYFFSTPDNHSQSWFHGISGFLFLFLPTVIATLSLPNSPIDIFVLHKFEKNIFLKLIPIFIGMQLCVAGFQLIQELLIPEFLIESYKELVNFYEDLYSPFINNITIWDYIRSIIIAALMPAIIEELLFRGFLMSCLRKKLKNIYALIITSVIFTILHFNPINMNSLLLIAFILGYVTIRTGSIFPAMILHFLNNMGGILFTVPDSTAHDLESNPILALSLLLSGIFLIIISFIILNKKVTPKAI